MNREEYLKHPEVRGFAKWLASEVVSRNFSLNFLRSRFVPMQIVENVQGIEGLLSAYCWKSAWKHPVTSAAIESQDWGSTQRSTTLLADGLREAMTAGDQQATLLWAECVLKWAGVSGALAFLRHEAEQGTLVQYLESVIPLLRLDSDVNDAKITDFSILRFDAGMTKIHAFIDQTGSPIYDSRVGAAISMFVGLYAGNRKIKGDVLRFPAGSARGVQIRNPGKLGLSAAPKFYTNAVSREYWARSQLRLGWILQAVLEQSGILSSFPTQPERLQAFQGALFMAGYDLRCFQVTDNDDVAAYDARAKLRNEPLASPLSHGHEKNTSEPFAKVVPSGFTTKKVVNLFGRYSASLGEGERSTRADFIRWQVDQGGNKKTAGANCFPFAPSELDLYGKSAHELQDFYEGGYEALRRLVPEAQPSRDEREHICLICTFLAGVAAEHFLTPRQRLDWLANIGFAGTENSAKTIMSVGRSFGRHFGLIDAGINPTDNFSEYFQGQAWRELHPENY